MRLLKVFKKNLTELKKYDQGHVGKDVSAPSMGRVLPRANPQPQGPNMRPPIKPEINDEWDQIEADVDAKQAGESRGAAIHQIERGGPMTRQQTSDKLAADRNAELAGIDQGKQALQNRQQATSNMINQLSQLAPDQMASALQKLDVEKLKDVYRFADRNVHSGLKYEAKRVLKAMGLGVSDTERAALRQAQQPMPSPQPNLDALKAVNMSEKNPKHEKTQHLPNQELENAETSPGIKSVSGFKKGGPMDNMSRIRRL